MNVFVVTRGRTQIEEWDHKLWKGLRERGHSVTIADPTLEGDRGNYFHKSYIPDAIIGMGVTSMAATFAAVERWPTAKLYCYNWDVYEWVWTKPRPNEYDYKQYGDLLRLAREVWVPSECTGRRTTQWYGLTNWQVALSACPWWEHDNIRDDGYALMCMREIPDPWWGVFERCCEELGIPYKSTRHECSEAKYRDAVAGCRFICCPLYECSTGGLSLMEAYYHGKPVLLSDSEWNGGKDYMKDQAVYFRHGDEDNFKSRLQQIHSFPPVYDVAECREFIESNYSDTMMADRIHERITA